VGAGPERVVLRGEDVILRPRAVLTLAMAVHELTTNAAKYGALSVPGGRIEVRWAPFEGADGRQHLRIDWIEQGGPPAADPQQRGFGSRLIEGSIAAELGGKARLAFAPEGLRCEIAFPLEQAKPRRVADKGPR
jgi:two-component sensor histidine kinase